MTKIKVVTLDDAIKALTELGFDVEAVPPAPPSELVEFRLSNPIPNPFTQFRLTQDFNLNIQWYKGIGGHDGIDIGTPMNTPIYAANAGDVTVAGYRPGRGDWDPRTQTGEPYGDHVRIVQHALDHAGEERIYTTISAHLSRVDVKVGDVVEAGQQIGLSGGIGSRAGNSSGAHLHFGVICQGAKGRGETFLNADVVNPWLWMNYLREIDNLSKKPINRRKVRADINGLNVRNMPALGASVVRFTMMPDTEFDVYELSPSGAWGALDASRTAWCSVLSKYSTEV